MRLVGVVLVLASGRAVAEPHPYSLSTDGGVSLGTQSIFPRASVTIARQFWSRMHVGLRVAGGGRPSFVTAEQTAEVGLWLYPSRSTRLLLGWRVGHAYLRDTDGGATASVNAMIVETFAEIELELGTFDLRIAPMVITGYRSGLWLFAIGPEVGVSTWF